MTLCTPDPESILDALIEFSGAERGFLVLRENGDLVVRTARHMEREEVRRAREKVSRTVLERALAEGRPLVASDADISGSGSLRQQKVRSVCALPLRQSRGVVYLDHRYEKGLFENPESLDGFARRLDAALRRPAEGEPGRLVGSSKPMRELRRTIDKVAASPYPVLICGESGTGKELAAREIHRRGPRARGPFVAANCAAFPETLVDTELFGHAKGAFTGADRDRPGLFEQAHGGILFLDEVACLSAGAQEALLRVLETSEVRRVGGTGTALVDVRAVAATNGDLEDSGAFRRDLFYRLNVLRLDLPPLRDRREDIPELAEHFLDRIARETRAGRMKLSSAALAVLEGYSWPGNVRELENALRRAASLTDAGTLEAADFPFLRERPPAGEEGPIASLEEHVRRVLLRWNGKLGLKEIAERLGMSRKTLWEKKKKLGL